MSVAILGSPLHKAEARNLLDFDVASLRRLAESHDVMPHWWAAESAGYEAPDRVLRDSPTYRLLAFGRDIGRLYATDGCNACFYSVPRPLCEMDTVDLAELADRMQVNPAFLEFARSLDARLNG